MSRPTSGADETQRRYRIILTAQIGAGLSQWLDVILIFSVPVLQWQSSPREMALVASSLALPGLLLGPIIGTWLDRSNVARFLLAGALMRIISSILLCWCANMQWFYPLVVLKALGNTVYWGASGLLVNRVFSQPVRERYFSTLSIADQLTRILAPLLIAGAYSLGIDGSAPFLLPAGVAGLSLLTLLPALAGDIRLGKDRDGPKHDRAPSSFMHDLVQGLRMSRALSSSLKRSIMISIGASAALAIYDPHLSAILHATGHPETAYPALLSATAAGAATAGLVFKLTVAGKHARYTRMIRIGVSLFACSVFAGALIFWSGKISVVLLCATWLVGGIGYELLALSCILNLQHQCPPDYLGRISTLVRSAQLSCIALFPLLGSALMAALAPFAPLVLSGTLSLALWHLLARKPGDDAVQHRHTSRPDNR